MFVNLYLDEDKRKTLFGDMALDEWKQIEIGDEKKISLEKILQYDKIVINCNILHHLEGIVLTPKDNNTLEIKTNIYSNGILDFITSKIDNHKLKFYTNESEKGTVYHALSKGNNEVEIDNWRAWFKLYLYAAHYSRNLMPCVEDYKAIRVKENSFKYGSYDFTFSEIKQTYPIMICPYIRFSNNEQPYEGKKLKISVSEKLYKLVYDNRFDESVTMEQIKKTYQLFLDDTKQYVQSFLEKTIE